MNRRLLIVVLCCFVVSINNAQSNYRKKFEQIGIAQHDFFEHTRSERQKRFDQIRRNQTQRYVEQLRKRWMLLDAIAPLSSVERNQIIPIEYVDTIVTPTVITHTAEEHSSSLKAINTDAIEKIVIDTTLKDGGLVRTNEDIIFLPKPTPQPQPIADILPIKQEFDLVSTALYGTLMSVAFPKNADLHLQNVDENAIATLWQQIADTVVPSRFDMTIVSCLKNRDELKLCDWTYLKMVQAIAKRRYGNTNEATIFAAYIMAESGYKIRLAFTENYVYMLLASQHEIYQMSRFFLDDEWYYMIDGRGESSCYISNVGYDKEQKFSLFIASEQKIESELSDTVVATSRKGWALPVQTNLNMIDFYDEYPTGRIEYGQESSKWLLSVNTPLDSVTKAVLYPQLRDSIKGLSSWQATSMILNWVQTALHYELDENVWGYDRIFFPTETLHYPASDCEDRAILFTNLIRDIMGLEVILLYYDNPCHLATAVHFPVEETDGEYVMYNNKRYVVCDPTYINAPVGKQMSYFKGVEAQIIVID